MINDHKQYINSYASKYNGSMQDHIKAAVEEGIRIAQIDMEIDDQNALWYREDKVKRWIEYEKQTLLQEIDKLKKENEVLTRALANTLIKI